MRGIGPQKNLKIEGTVYILSKIRINQTNKYFPPLLEAMLDDARSLEEKDDFYYIQLYVARNEFEKAQGRKTE